MTTSDDARLAEALQACESEPIHLPGLIQPHGALLAIRTSRWDVVHASANVNAILGLAPEIDPLDRQLEAILAPEEARVVTQACARINPGSRFPVNERFVTGGRAFDMTLRAAPGMVLAEFEPAAPAGHHSGTFETLQAGLDALGAEREDLEVWRMAAALVRRLGGLDRVMIYRFDQEWNGEVVAEDRRADLEPFLGLHYPASDIPAQARRLYERSLARYIPDIDYRPVEVRRGLAAGPEPLDLGLAILRSVSPVHLEYLRNMGVRGTFVLSLMVEGKLWGLIACHQYSVARLSVAQRRAIGLVAQTLGALIGQAGRRAEAEEDARFGVLREHVMAATEDEGRQVFADFIAQFGEQMRDVLAASAIVTWSPEGVASLGAGLSEAGRRALVDLCRVRLAEAPVWATDRLGAEFPVVAAACGFSGVLAARSDSLAGAGVAVLRPEQAREVVWAGAPDKSVTLGQEGYRLSPRRSFVAWREQVSGRSRPWSDSSRRLLRDLVADIEVRVLKHAFEATKRFRELAEQAPIMIWMCDIDGKCFFANRATHDFFGTEPAGLPGIIGLERVHEDDRPPVREHVGAAVARRVPYALEYRCLNEDGQYRWLRVTAGPRCESGAAFDGYIGTMVDVTDQKEAETVMRDAARRLESRVSERTAELTEALGELEAMSSAVSHDLVAPLHHVAGFAGLLALDEAVRASPTATDFTDRIIRSAERMHALIDKLIENMRLGRAVLNVTRVPLGSLVRGYVDDVSATIGARRIEWRVGELPTVWCDPVMARQVVQNLIENAVKYTGRREVARIEIDAVDTGDMEGFFVRDNGVGFDMRFAGQLFGVFRRLHSEADFPGIGIGLANLRRIMQKHDGRVWCEAVPGQGATFFVAFPKRHGNVQDGDAAAFGEPAHAAAAAPVR